MKTYRWNDEKTVIKIHRRRISIQTDASRNKIHSFQCGKYLIKIDQSRAMELCRIQRIKNRTILVLSRGEADPLLKHLDIDNDFRGLVLHLSNRVSVIVLYFEAIIQSAKRRNVWSVRKEVVSTLAHEMRHINQGPDNDLCRLIARWQNISRLFKKIAGKSMFLKVILYANIGAIYVLLPFSMFLRVIILLPIFILTFTLINYDITNHWFDYFNPKEKDARAFAQKAVQNKRWLKCVEVSKIARKEGTPR